MVPVNDNHFFLVRLISSPWLQFFLCFVFRSDFIYE